MKNSRRQARSKTPRKKEPAAGDALLRRIEQLADSDPEDFGFLVGRIFRLLVEREREAYDYLMVKVIFATLQESGFLARFDELKELLSKNNVSGASGIVEAIGTWTKTIETFASTEASDILRADQEHRAANEGAQESKTWVM